MGSATALVCLVALASACGETSHPPFAVCRPPAERAPGLWIAGSGANLALARALAARWSAQHPEPRVVIPESIGTGGALQALRAGAIDVGLASRALTAAERGEGLQEAVLGQVAYAPTVKIDITISTVSPAELAALFGGARPAGWPRGVPVAPVLREEKDSGYVLVAARFPAIRAAFDAARASERLPVRYTDQEMRDTLLTLDGAIGFLDVATVRLERLPLRSLALDGVEPTADNVRSGRYPLVRQLSLVTRGPPQGDAARFVAFARSDEVADLFEAAGMVR